MYRVKSEGEGDCEMMLQDQMDSPVADDVSSGGGSPHPHRGAGPPLKKGPWTSAEDAILVDYVKKHGEGNWNAVQKNTGLFRCGKSCRLRWANHLRPNLKKGAFTPEEERLIIQLHAKMGNKWARMAAHMPKKASWDDPTCAVFLDLVRKQKELCYWNHKIHTPSSLGWTNIWREFNEATRRGYDKKTLQNKYNELKRQYFLWRDGHTQTGLGRDPVTGEVTADPAWFDQQPGESSQPPDERFKRPQCCDILFTILGHTPRDRGELFPAGGHEPDQTSPRWSCWVLAAACWRHFF